MFAYLLGRESALAALKSSRLRSPVRCPLGPDLLIEIQSPWNFACLASIKIQSPSSPRPKFRLPIINWSGQRV